jgi:hypothetical protein
MTSPDRVAIWEALDELSRRHRAFGDAFWALPQDELDRIDQVGAKFRPNDEVETARFLFDEDSPDIGQRHPGDFAEYEAALRQARTTAVEAILAAHELEGIYRLVGSAKEAFLIGLALGDSAAQFDERRVLADLDNDGHSRATFARGLVQARANAGDEKWLKEAVDQRDGHPLSQARILLASQDLAEAWDQAKKLGPTVDGAYWKEFRHFGRGHDFALVAETAERLLAHSRPAAAVDLLALYVDRVEPTLPAELVAEALGQLVKAKPEDSGGLSSYELDKLLQVLRGSDLHEDEIAILEWQLLPALGYGASSPILERRLAKDPAFFVEVLSMCFKRKDGTNERDPSPEMASNAYRLLDEWRVVPGSDGPGAEVEGGRLGEWLEEARRLLSEVDRAEIGDLYIGHILAHSNEDPDGTWPTLPVRDAIQRLGVDEIDRGVRTEKYNMRGVTSRRLTDGGKQEFELADQFDHQASLVADKWPRSAAILRSLADAYRAEGRGQDEEAKRHREGLSR